MSQYGLNSGKHIDDVIRRTTCDRHNGDKGIACFYVFYGSKNGEAGPAICGDRVKAAGFNGKIQPSSLRLKAKDGNAYSRR